LFCFENFPFNYRALTPFRTHTSRGKKKKTILSLVIACKDKEKKSHPPPRGTNLLFLYKKVTSVVNRNLQTKQQSFKAFKLKFINFAHFFRKNT